MVLSHGRKNSLSVVLLGIVDAFSSRVLKNEVKRVALLLLGTREGNNFTV